MGQDLHCRLAALMPRLRRFGIALGRSADNVDDLARAPRERVQRCQTQGRGGTQSGESTRVRDWPINESRARCDDGETADEADGDAAGRLAESTIALAAGQGD